ncbi:phosphoglycerate kinase [Candidatus Micrarchaeota archaeon]|nr:phosphoglycerate kinase [Candidatus Micrarchaeota archaeon]
MRKINEIDVNGKTVIVRVDLNCPVEKGKITGCARIYSHAGTIRNLSGRGAKVVVLSHQGREGRDDFIGLEQHSKLLQQILHKEIKYVDQVVGPRSEEAIKNLKDGEIVLLDNVRRLKSETIVPEGKGELIQRVGPLADYYVLDALSVAHRKHSSVIGFSETLPCFAGQILADELDAVDIIRNGSDVVFVLGGSKIDDSFSIMKKWLFENRAKEVLVGGAVAILLLYASGKDIGDSAEYLKEKGLLDKKEEAKKIIDEYDGRIIVPVDVAISVDSKRTEVDVDHIHGRILDIGEKTMYDFYRRIMNAKYVIMNGPLGVYEDPKFAVGTSRVFHAMSKTKAYTLLGGGHTIAAMEKLQVDQDKFNYVSLSGKALIAYLCGEKLPGIEALKMNEKSFPDL